jgi:arylsulfatase A-like enzyme
MDKTALTKQRLKRRPGSESRPAEGWYEPASEWFEVPLMRDEVVLERAPNQALLTRRYTDASLEFIREHEQEPFFLYLSFNMPHVPLFRSPEFAGRSAAGLYGDVIEELDAGVGRVLEELRALDLEERTLVVFTSDNGPWLEYEILGGSAGPFRAGKSTAWEGGFRVPALFWAPGRVAPGVVQEMGSTMDLMATFASLTDAELPEVQLDGFDLTPVLVRDEAGPRQEMFFYLGDRLAAVRRGPFKAHFLVPAAGKRGLETLAQPLLFNVNEDPGERFDLAPRRPEIVAELTRLRDAHQASIVEVENQLLRR